MFSGNAADFFLLFVRAPRGGIPVSKALGGGAIAARAPIYGAEDAVRRFWVRLLEVM